MVEEGRDCSEVLIQLSAVKSAINNTGKVILQDHIEHCIVDAIESGDHEALDELNKADFTAESCIRTSLQSLPSSTIRRIDSKWPIARESRFRTAFVCAWLWVCP